MSYNPIRTELLAFYVSVGAMLLVFSALALSVTPLFWVATGLTSAVVCILASFLSPRRGLLLYRVWHKLNRLFVAYARLHLMFVSYFLVICPVSWLRPRWRVARPALLVWTPRTAHRLSFDSLHGGMRSTTSLTPSWRSFLRWAQDTRNLWALALLPFLGLLSLLDAEEQTDVATDIYTLF